MEWKCCCFSWPALRDWGHGIQNAVLVDKKREGGRGMEVLLSLFSTLKKKPCVLYVYILVDPAVLPSRWHPSQLGDDLADSAGRAVGLVALTHAPPGEGEGGRSKTSNTTRSTWSCSTRYLTLYEQPRLGQLFPDLTKLVQYVPTSSTHFQDGSHDSGPSHHGLDAMLLMLPIRLWGECGRGWTEHPGRGAETAATAAATAEATTIKATIVRVTIAALATAIAIITTVTVVRATTNSNNTRNNNSQVKNHPELQHQHPKTHRVFGCAVGGARGVRFLLRWSWPGWGPPG